MDHRIGNPARARFLRRAVLLAAAAINQPSLAKNADDRRLSDMQQRRIPSSHALLPVIGCGTWLGFDVVEGSPAFDALREVVRTLFAAGGTVLDSSPMYGRSEAVIGRLLAEQPGPGFVATKVCVSHYTANADRELEAVMRAQAARLPADQLRDRRSRGREPHPAVTCAIPGTGNPRHMAENVAAGTGPIPDAAFWKTRIDAIVS